jgi:hypothetical protein
MSSFFAAGDRARWQHAVDLQATLAHPDEVFLRDSAISDLAKHDTKSSGMGVTFTATASDTGGRSNAVFFKLLCNIHAGVAHDYGHISAVGVTLNEIAAWQLARELGPPWDALATPVVLWTPPGTSEDQHGCLVLGRTCPGSMASPAAGYEQAISDAAFFDALIGHQDRHDDNFRSSRTPPLELALIDNGFSMARPGDLHNRYPTAGFFGHLRHGRRVFADAHRVPGLGFVGGPLMDFRGDLGVIDKALQEHEKIALNKLLEDPTLLGLTPLLAEDRAEALRARAGKMLATSNLLKVGDF